MDSLIKEIKNKKELSDLSDSLVESCLKNYLSKNKIAYTKNIKSRKLIVKEIRSELRRYAGQYNQISSTKRKKLISSNQIEKLLKSHSSTRERIEDYDYIKSIIKKLNPKSILDLGCGLNPLAIGEKNIVYYAYDIKNEDIQTVSDFFAKNKIEGYAIQGDITIINEFPKTDICLIFKVLDILPGDRYENSKNILNKLKSKKILVSFATTTLSGKKMNSPRRFWFEKLLDTMKLKYTYEERYKESFYLIENLQK
jgi:hypothetical protein